MQILGLSAFNIFNLRLQKLDFIELKSKVKFIKIPPYNANSPFLLLTATFIVTGTLWCLLLVGLASLISKQLQHKPHMASYISRGSSVILGSMGIHIGFSSLKEVL